MTPDSLIDRGLRYYGEIVSPDGEVLLRHDDVNLIPKVGRAHLAGLIRGTTAPISAWYAFLFAGDFTPDAGTVAGDLPNAAGEYTGYSEARRPAWVNTYDGDSSIDNLDSKIVFTFPNAKRIYGAGLVSAAGKGTNSGVLLSISRFDSPKDIPAGSTYRLAIGMTLVSS